MPGIIASAAVAITVRGQRVDADAGVAELLGHAKHAHAHAVLGDRIGDVRPEPARRHVERRRHRQHLRIAAARGRSRRGAAGTPARKRTPRRLTASIRSTRFYRRRQRAGQADRAGVVDQDVDAAEGVTPSATAAATIASSRMSHATASAWSRRRPRSQRPRNGSFRAGADSFQSSGGDDHVGAVARRAQRDRKADATRRAGDEQRLARVRIASGAEFGTPLGEERGHAFGEIVLRATLAERQRFGVQLPDSERRGDSRSRRRVARNASRGAPCAARRRPCPLRRRAAQWAPRG